MMENVSQETTAMQPDQAAAGNDPGKDLTGKSIGDFRLLRRLGQGGMGQVYLAEQLSLKRKVAIKVLRKELAANETALKRFETEALAVARATHANIVQVYAIGNEAGLHFMALEYVEGRNLREFLEKKGTPDVLICISIVRQVAAALQRASELGIVHRDIKPENILLTRKGEVKVTDFGLSRILAEGEPGLNLTQTGVTMGTPLYMSPEQVEGKTLDPRTDIYSLGVTAYHLLAGQPPFHGQTAFEVAVQHVQKDPAPLQQIRPDVPEELCVLVHKMMTKNPNDRYQTANEIVRDLGQLRDVLVGVSTAMPSIEFVSGPTGGLPGPQLITGSARVNTTATQSFPLRQRKNRLPWIAVVMIVFMLAAGMGLGWWANRGADSAFPFYGKRPDAFPGAPQDPFALEEQNYKKNFERYENPAPTDLRRGLDACMDLGLFYLKNQKLDKAEKFFTELFHQGSVNQYRYFGELGNAMVLAFRDEPAKSNELFMKLLTKGKFVGKGRRPIFARATIMMYPQLHQMIAKSLQRNYLNAPNDFPKRLEVFRRTPRLSSSSRQSP